MEKSVAVKHQSLRLERGFDEFTRRLEGSLRRFDARTLPSFKDDPKAAEESLRALAGGDGLLLFDVLDHGSLLALHGAPRKAKQYVVGNPLIAARMTRHDVRAALYAPLRLLAFERDDGAVGVEFDLPSSLFGQFRSAEIDAVASSLDLKLLELIERAASDAKP